jgi:hypothetical protein
MNEDPDRAEFGRLWGEIVSAHDAGDTAGEAAAKAALDAAIARRAAEMQSLAERYGPEPVVGTRVRDGPTIEHDPWHHDVGSSVVVRPEGSLIDRDELLRERPPEDRAT